MITHLPLHSSNKDFFKGLHLQVEKLDQVDPST